MVTERAPEHRRNPALEGVLADLAAAIGPGGDRLAARAGAPQRPVVLVVGTPRSGSTALMQWLDRGGFGVPSNLVSRFWRAPAVGALVQRLLFDPALDFRGELHLSRVERGLVSDLGKTRGPTSPHELWYFWRYFLGFGDPPVLGAEGRERADAVGFVGHLGALEAALDRPLALKALIAAWELPWLAAMLPTAVFVDLDRDPVATMASLLGARERYAGSRERWYSWRVPEGVPAGASPEAQVALQVRAIRGAIDAGLAEIDAGRVIRTSYEAWCDDPAALWATLADRIGGLGPAPVEGPTPRPSRVDPRLETAWRAAT